jgi:YegS/Rv2252/BmrU family lipid kinase
MQQNKDIRIILNPAADNGRSALHQGPITEILQSYARVDFIVSESAAHARQSAQEAAEAGYYLVVAAGGDGTVHQVVNGLMSVPESNTMLGVIPIGSGNDFAYANGISTNVLEAAHRLFEGEPRWLDLARVENENGRFVIMDNNFGIGFDAMVVVQTEKITWAHGFMKYLVAVFKTLAFHFDATRLQIRFDEEQVSQKSLLFYVGIGPRGGGGFLLTPDARQDDGLVDSCLVDEISRATLLSMLTKAMKGTHIHNKHASMRVNQQIIIQLDDLAPMYVDGEMFAYPEDNIRQITITSLPRGIQLLA